MKILIIGEGVRENSIAKKLSHSDRVSEIFITGGSAGMQDMAKCSHVPLTDYFDLREFALEKGIDMTIVGPEGPLLEGVVNIFQKKGLKILGPDRKASVLEGSKSFSKDFMKKYGIRTAPYESFTEYSLALDYIRKHPYPLVIKADGRAQGKTFEVPADFDHAEKILRNFMIDGKFGAASQKVVIEEFITGMKVSIISIFDGRKIVPLSSFMERRGSGERETPLMAEEMISDMPGLPYGPDQERDFRVNIMERTLNGLVDEKLIFSGVINFGVIMNEDGCHLMEYHLNFQDEETEQLMEKMDGDFAIMLEKIFDGELEDEDVISKKA